jgi:thiosulfate/3-mercaptopyruvate sulfurtransferase
VLYDQGGTYFAPRLMFSMYYHGFPAARMFVLDGGLSKWTELGMAVTKDVPPAPARGTFRITRTNEDARVRLPEFLGASGDPAHNALVEALTPDWHFGEFVFLDRGGHVPNASMMPTTDFFNADKTFKSPEEIKRMLAYQGVRPDQQVYTHCGGGGAAAVSFFAIKFMANYPKVKLYQESDMGWLADERGLPYWTYDAPQIMRETPWVASWGGKMLRSFGAAQVSIVDVRPADAFSEGHLPYSLNIPADVFRRNLADPAKLADVLGPAGVNAAYEAVVVSGAGVTTDSALAFVMLEKLGQKKVSVFTDTVEKWRQSGFTVATDATRVAPKKDQFDMAVPPTTYAPAPRKGVIEADANENAGLYPKVFIASGRDLPSKARDGKVVHIPYTELLNADGTPKAAKDIWNILVKAGVPRYAELVCISDDPGEAAANYFVLKLMGYPDIKVLLI